MYMLMVARTTHILSRWQNAFHAVMTFYQIFIDWLFGARSVVIVVVGCWLLVVAAGSCRICVRLLKFSHENSVNCKYWNWILSQNPWILDADQQTNYNSVQKREKNLNQNWKSSVDVKCTRYSYKYYSLTFQLVLCASASPSGSSVDVIFSLFHFLF